MLLSVGARGYEKASVQEVLERSGISRERFQRRFGGKEACFAQAYEMAADRLCAEVLEAARGAESWRAGFRAALARLLRTRGRAAAAGESAADRGAGGARPRLGQAPAGDRALRRGRRLRPPRARRARHRTALTAQFVVGAVEEAICAEIGAGRTATVERLLPDLTHLAVLNYFGEDEAWLELGSANLTPVDPSA